ncbi:Bro-N domain-containing protein [[Clostridium] innocuum]|uniref:BRO-N domain-containing protein n=1 Tax=Clostridium innocuum TaxID=1522 RepID=UPI003A4D5481
MFKNDEFGEVRTTIIEGKPYFCGSDVAKALGYSNPKKAVTDHCEEDGVTTCSLIDFIWYQIFFKIKHNISYTINVQFH